MDHAVGLTEVAAPGEQVGQGGRPLALVHAADREAAERAATAVAQAYSVGGAARATPPVVLEVLR